MLGHDSFSLVVLGVKSYVVQDCMWSPAAQPGLPPHLHLCYSPIYMLAEDRLTSWLALQHMVPLPLDVSTASSSSILELFRQISDIHSGLACFKSVNRCHPPWSF